MPAQPVRSPGPRPAPRFQLDPVFVRTVRTSGLPLWKLAALCGFNGNQDLSTLLCAPVVAATPLVVERLRTLAAALGHPRDRVFVGESDGEPA